MKKQRSPLKGLKIKKVSKKALAKSVKESLAREKKRIENFSGKNRRGCDCMNYFKFCNKCGHAVG